MCHFPGLHVKGRCVLRESFKYGEGEAVIKGEMVVCGVSGDGKVTSGFGGRAVIVDTDGERGCALSDVKGRAVIAGEQVYNVLSGAVTIVFESSGGEEVQVGGRIVEVGNEFAGFAAAMVTC